MFRFTPVPLKWSYCATYVAFCHLPSGVGSAE